MAKRKRTTRPKASKPEGWPELREQLRAELNRPDVSMLRLARESGVSLAELAVCVDGRESPLPGEFIALWQWMKSRQDAAAELDQLKRLRQKRRCVPLTASTLAEKIGITPAAIASALAGRQVPSTVKSLIEAWVSG